MKRIERNTYNSLRKSITADTICVEIPTEYTHEGRQGIHEMLTIEKHMRASSILWNDIEKCYCIHYVPCFDEYDNKRRMEQEAQDIDEIMNSLPKSDMTWNGFQKPSEETEEQTTNDTKSEEENTMKNTKSMTKSEAIREIATLSSSTLARICGSTNYSVIDDCCNRLILAASSMADDAFCDCENWIDVLHTINASTDNEIDNPYLLGNMDYRDYLTKYGHAEAVTILRNYIETITIEGIQNTKWEQDYIRGAKDMLAIA